MKNRDSGFYRKNVMYVANYEVLNLMQDILVRFFLFVPLRNFTDRRSG